MTARDDTHTTRRDFVPRYSPHHPIPTISRYREEKAQRGEAHSALTADAEEPSWPEKTATAAKNCWTGESAQSAKDADGGSKQHYQSRNKNYPQPRDDPDSHDENDHHDEPTDTDHNLDECEKDHEDDDRGGELAEDTSESMVSGRSPKDKRKNMKRRTEDPTERTVTDPVTHLPITIHDFTNKDLKNVPENENPPNSTKRCSTGAGAKEKDHDQLQAEADESEQYHSGIEAMFPPPSFENTRNELTKIYQNATTVVLGLVVGMLLAALTAARLFAINHQFAVSIAILVIFGLGVLAVLGMRSWIENKVDAVWNTELWEAERQTGKALAKSETPESTQWLNSLLAAIWPLVNPDLFTSLADTLEDVMQASLPKLVRMVSVEDLGQGSEAIRILGVRWLPTGAAAMSVSEKGRLKKDVDPKKSDRTVPGQGENRFLKKCPTGDFVNLEVAFAYRSRTVKKGIRDRAKNAHLYLAFYLPGNIKFPVWVELEGFVGTIRARLQLTPDPPFFSLCTLTFLGQPKVDVSCVPLTRRGLDIMDIPLISNFVQSAVDAAMAEYVAPKSLTLDLKDMLMGDDFKKDTSARGVIVVHIKRAFGFKEGDFDFLWKKGSTDGYISVGWAKFKKPLWSTRIIEADMEPCWDETTFVLVTPDELNVDERLRVQLWDSDRTTADDDLGRIEVDIKQLMRDPRSSGKMMDRLDGFRALEAGKGMPGKLEWSVGYFSKTRILDSQLVKQSADPNISTLKDLRTQVDDESERKLREAKKDETRELEQQKAQTLKERQDQLIVASPPPSEYPSGILSITIHQITGVELERLNKPPNDSSDIEEEEKGEDLPSSYCTIIMNHRKVYRTRTKPKNAQPFFNAGCERFIGDWRETDIHVSVRDARVHEDDPLLGVIYLPLSKVLAKRSQINAFFPLAGGIGYGRARISMVFRAVKLQAPRPALGWDYGTLLVAPQTVSTRLPEDYKHHRLKLRVPLGSSKMHPTSNSLKFRTHGSRPLSLPVARRHRTPLTITLRPRSTHLHSLSHALSSSSKAGNFVFGVTYLKDIADNEDADVRIGVYGGRDAEKVYERVKKNVFTKVGEVVFTLRFVPGLSRAHRGLARRDVDVAHVMEVLEAVQDCDGATVEAVQGNVGAGIATPSTTRNSRRGSETSEGDASSSQGASRDEQDGSSDGKRNAATDGHRGLGAAAKEYKRTRKNQHRRHRGLMQWKGPRTVKWLGHKVEHGGMKVKGALGRREKGGGIESEA
ncbi:meiotically up-regulated gene 190 protein [Phyllosticta citriasiana]|uniref:meiotically up-regulated gene 190 protein n=1 Tax=Phyllosticta citriasiana TaxID=595635 RepID=UPI0030FDACD9